MTKKYSEQEDNLIIDNYSKLGSETTRMLLFKHGFERNREFVSRRAKQLGVQVDENAKKQIQVRVKKAFVNDDYLLYNKMKGK